MSNHALRPFSKICQLCGEDLTLTPFGKEVRDSAGKLISHFPETHACDDPCDDLECEICDHANQCRICNPATGEAS